MIAEITKVFIMVLFFKLYILFQVLVFWEVYPFDIAKIGGGKKLLGYRYVNVRLTEIFITFAPKTRTK